MNTVKDLRRALSREVRRLQPPAGLEARVLEQAFRGSAVVRSSSRAWHRGSVRTSPLGPVSAPRLIPLLAVLIAVAIVATLIGVRALHLLAPTPANRGIVPVHHHNGQIVLGGWTWAGDSPPDTACPIIISGPSCHSSPASSLIAIDPPTGGLHKILSAPKGETVSDAAYSPDGTNLAYVLGPGGDFDLSLPSTFGSPALAQSSIWILNTVTGRANQITTCHCQQLGHLGWSPDGLRLAFSDGDPVSGAQLYVIDADGSHKSQLTHFKKGQNATQPSWSPDGTQIVFSLFSAVATFGGLMPGSIYVIRPDGSGLAVLLRPEVNSPYLGSWREPAWSPDGSKIAYVELAAGPTRGGQVIGWSGSAYQLWLMDPDGSHRTQIFGIGRPSGPQLDDYAWGGPAWSPDGTQIAFVAAPLYTLWVINADGSEPRSLSDAVGGDRPTWQPLP